MLPPLTVIDPRTGRAVSEIQQATQDDVTTAVERAVSARDAWADAAPAQRIKTVRGVITDWAARSDELTALVLSELGQPERFTRTVHVENALSGAQTLTSLAGDIGWTESVGESTIHRRAVGVVAALTPWNYPVHQVLAKVVPALLAGCAVVLKPSELAPMSADLLVEVARAQLPDHLVQVVHGGPTVGTRLVSQEALDLVSFTGSSRVGRTVAEAAARVGTPTLLELGGRSPAIVLDDLDEAGFSRAVRYVVADAMSNCGQACNALSRLIVPRSRHGEALAAVLAAAQRFVPGTTLGPVRRADDVERLRSWVDAAQASGAQVVLDGRAAAGPEGGFWFGVTVLDIDAATDPIVREEVFGPVLTLETFDDSGHGDERDDAATGVARAASLGLSAAVWAADVRRAERCASALRVGQVRINGAGWDFQVPFGGFGAAGWGREWGRAGIEAFTTTRTILR